MGTGTQSCGVKEPPPDEEQSRALMTAQKVFVIKRLPLLADTGHCPEFVLLDTRAILSALRRRRCNVPKGQAKIARRFNAGFAAKRSRVPKGRSKSTLTPNPSAVPSGLGCLAGCFPALKRRAILKRSLRDKGTQRILFLALQIRTTLHSRRRFEWSEAPPR